MSKFRPCCCRYRNLLIISANSCIHSEFIHIVLHLTDSPHVENQEDLAKLQDSLQEALSEQCTLHYPSDAKRCSRLLMSLPLLRQVAMKAVAFFHAVRQRGNITMRKLFLEMLDAKI